MKTQRLRLDFAPNPRRVSRIGMLMLFVAGSALVAGALELSNVVAANARLADTLAAVDARRGTVADASAKTTAPDPGEAARMRAVRQVSQSLMTPWADLLESLESVPVQTVAVLSIEPSVSKHTIRITAEARTAPDMLAYLGALQREPRLSSVVLVSHQVQVQAPGTPVRFQIRAAWGAAQ
jgi:Tfp pilus assembly protein PilN